MKSAGPTPKVVLTSITVLATLIGSLKTLASETTGSALPAGHLLFYIGGSAIALYIACVPGGMAGTGVMGLASMAGADKGKAAWYLASAVGLIVGALTVIALASAGVLWDYDGLDLFGRIFISLIGLGVLALPVYFYVRDRDRKD